MLSAGDNIGAAPLVSSLFHDEPTVTFLNELGVAASAVGNHEVDHGVRELARLSGGGCAPDGCSPGEPFTGAAFDFLADFFAAQAAPRAGRVVGTATAPLARASAAGESPLGAVIADAMLDVTDESARAVAAR